MDINADSRVARNDVSRAGRCSADGDLRGQKAVVALADNFDAIRTVANGKRSGEAGPDVISLDDIVLHVAAVAGVEFDAVSAVAGDDIARAVGCAADGDALHVREINSVPGISQRVDGRIHSDVIPFNHVPVGVGKKIDSRGIAGDDVSIGGRRAADDCVVGELDTDPDAIAAGIDAIRLNSDVISGDDVIFGALIESDSRVVKMIDRQPAYGGVADVDFQSDAAALNARPVELDQWRCAALAVAAVEPGWVYPSMVTGLSTAGSALSGVIVCMPPPGMLKSIVSFVPSGWVISIWAS